MKKQKYLNTRNRHICTAVQVTAENAEKVAEWAGGNVVKEFNALNHDDSQPGINIRIGGGDWDRASLNDWVVLDGDGEFWVVKPGYFQDTYEVIL